MIKTLFLLYHDLDSPVLPSEKKDLATLETVVRLKEFEEHMAFLYHEGYNVLSVREYLDLQRKGALEERDIVLTFDDGHISNFVLAFPVLQKFAFKATFFVIASRIGIPHHMGLDALRKLVDAGMEIGSHGLTHTYLPELSQQEVRNELVESRRCIQEAVNHPVGCFAYPGGHYTTMVLDCVRETGYQCGVSCIVGRNSSGINPFLLRRLEMRRGTSSTDFERAIQPSSVMFYQFICAVKTGVKKIIGLERYTALRKKMYFLYPFKR